MCECGQNLSNDVRENGEPLEELDCFKYILIGVAIGSGCKMRNGCGKHNESRI